MAHPKKDEEKEPVPLLFRVTKALDSIIAFQWNEFRSPAPWSGCIKQGRVVL